MRVVTTFGVAIPMRDGTELIADVYAPDVEERVPAVLLRTPYGRAFVLMYPHEFYGGMRFMQAGYAVVVQDTRGRCDSGGSFYPFRTESDDGVDSIEWIASQPWSDGRVAMAGGSYVGATQWLPASTNPSALRAIAPIVTASEYREGWIFGGDALELGFILDWTLLLCVDTARRRIADGSGSKELLDRVVRARDRIEDLYRGLDDDARDLLMELAPYYFDWLAHPEPDPAWPSIAPNPDPGATVAPALNIGGWYDIFVSGTLRNFRLQRAAALAEGRPGPRLIVGPWTHDVYTGIFVGRGYGLKASIDSADIAGEQVRWFDRWVRGQPNGVEDLPPVRVFVMGQDAWRDFDDWPPSSAVASDFYLRRSNGLTERTITTTPPQTPEPSDALVFDPSQPVPTIGGATIFAGSRVGARAGPADMAPIEGRPDVLVYTSQPLEERMTLVGDIELHVIAAAGSGFDLVAHLTDVAPDGRSELLTGGILRVSAASATGLQTVAMGSTAAMIDRNHRIRVDIAASDFPRYDLNPSAVAAGPSTVSIGGAIPPRLVLRVLS